MKCKCVEEVLEVSFWEMVEEIVLASGAVSVKRSTLTTYDEVKVLFDKNFGV